METAYLLFGIIIGILIGQQYFKYQIIRKHNKKIIEQVKAWISESEN